MTSTQQYSPKVFLHPGLTLEEKLGELSMGPKEFAIRTDKPEKTINAILKGDSSITPDMAVRFEDVLKIPAHFWLNSQRLYDEGIARQKRQGEVGQAIGWAKNFPIAAMVKNAWIERYTTWEEKTEALLSFFGISTPKAWEDYYIKQELKVAFRISLANSNAPQAISAWLRQGEITAAALKGAVTYNEKAFRESLPEIKALMASHPIDFFVRLQTLCMNAGVKVVYTPCLPKATCNGATRWLGDTPLIQLSNRYKRNDSFWFTFFHEAGHILLHGKKDIFLEIRNYNGRDPEKETEADVFAEKWILSEKEERDILATKELTLDDVENFAKRFGTHPAMIIGRLQHKGIISYDGIGNKLIVPVNLS